MKIASFNINNINRRLGNLLHWPSEAGPDIVRLQEIKAADTEFPTEAIRQAGDHAGCRADGREPWLRELPVAPLYERTAPCGHRRLGYLGARRGNAITCF